MSNLTPAPGPGYADQSSRRTVLRVTGVVLMGAAIVLLGIAVADFFAATSSADFGAEPTKFWMFFLALPFFAVGGICLQLGFAGAGARYLAGEYAPVLKESMDYLGVAGERPRRSGTGPYCRSCGRQNDSDARFCDGCGSSMAT